MRKSINPLEVSKTKGAFSQVLKVGDFVYISGQVGVDNDLKVEEGLNSQVEKIFERVNRLLKELNMHINQVVKVTVYLKSGEDQEVFDKLYASHFKHPFPARSVVFVDKLSKEDALVEMAFDAIDLSAYEAMQGCEEDGCEGCSDTDCDFS